MIDLDISSYHSALSISEKDGKRYIFDPVRKAQFVVQPEELVRQTWIQYLHHEHEVSFAALGVEKKITIQEVSRRYDMVYFKKAEPHILFEFKSYKTPLDSASALQVAHYNLELKVPYIVLSNGLQTFVYQASHERQEIEPLEKLPF